jgi:hypothetical protein
MYMYIEIHMHAKYIEQQSLEFFMYMSLPENEAIINFLLILI